MVARYDNGAAIVGAEINGPTLVFAFAGLGEVARDMFWGETYFRKCGFSFVSFVPKTPNWYPGETFVLSPEIEVMIEPLTDRVTYGYSMGGHAALKAVSLFGAKRAVAVCPQYSIDPDVLVDKRWNPFWTEASGTHHMLHKPAEARRIIFSDPAFALDREHIDKIAEIAPLEMMECNAAGHNIWGALEKRNLMGSDGVFTQAISGQLTIEVFSRLYADHDATSLIPPP